MVASRETFPLLAELLADQQLLQTPAATFASAHESGTLPAALARHRALIPLTAPGPGEHYAFEVELDSCTGCKSCVAACHALNGLDETETWRDVGMLVGGNRQHPFTQTITSACHHCTDPACLNGCPVLAYEKDPLTGIVVHLDDQCIGCQYCVLKCPYDAPKYNARLGIVRKCDMCHGRLAAGEAPACAQACPTHAIRIVTVANAPDRNVTAPSTIAFLPAAPAPDYTQPTTRYISKRLVPANVAAGDERTLRPQPPHWPLVAMLTLMPVAVGLCGAAAMHSRSGVLDTAATTMQAAAICGAVGLAASAFHLGQPLRAWRIFLGWRQSWLSREAMVFSAWAPLAGAALIWPILVVPAAVTGLVGLACSAMIYIDTRRHFWRAAQTAPRFFGTAAVVALAATAPRVAAFVLLLKIAWETRTFFDGSISARLQRGPLSRLTAFRDSAGFTAVVALAVGESRWAVVPLLLGEFLERTLFFRAVDAPKMPGMPSQ